MTVHVSTPRPGGGPVVFAILGILLLPGVLHAGRPGQEQTTPDPPQPARNEVARDLDASDEVLMLRHQRFEKGTHAAYYEASRSGVWPWFERLGARMTGQWQVVYPEGNGSREFDEGYRLARYASFEHWRHTRGPLSRALAGNGPNRDLNTQSLRMRGLVSRGSEGGYFLQGLTARTKPWFMPGLAETYELVPGLPTADDAVVAVRHDVAQPGPATVLLQYSRIRKGTFEQILDRTVAAVWPFEEKLGARPIGQWRVIYPNAPSRTEESPDYDEMITLTRYASYAHYRALRPGQAVLLGGNGPDWRAWQQAVETERGVTLETRTDFLRGYDYTSPPLHQPALPEAYRVR